MQGFFWTELVEFAGRELPSDTVRAAVREVWPDAPASLDPALPCAPERLVALADRLATAASGGDPAPTGGGADAWLRRFGRALFAKLAATHVVFFVGIESAFDFLGGFERQVHDELRRLGRGLAPPRIDCERRDAPAGARRLALTYRSDRGLAALAHGMLEGCLAHFGDTGRVARVPAEEPGTARFVVEVANRDGTD